MKNVERNTVEHTRSSVVGDRHSEFSVTSGFMVASTHAKKLYEQNVALTLLNMCLRIKVAENSVAVYALQRAEFRYRSFLNNATEGIVQWTPSRRLFTANSSFASMLGFCSVADLRTAFSLNPFSFFFREAAAALVEEELECKGSINDFEFELYHRNGTPLWGRMKARRIVGAKGQTSYYEAFIENITARKNSENTLFSHAFYDSLTGLANRALFLNRLTMAIKRFTRHPEDPFAVVLLDLDKFKDINDYYGRHIGDVILQNVAKLLCSCMQSADAVSRIRDNEFGIIVANASCAAHCLNIIRRILESLHSVMLKEEQMIHLKASIGVVLRAERYLFAEDVLRDANIAMHRAKINPRKRFYFFNRRMHCDAVASVTMDVDLRNSLRNAELYFEYQRIICLKKNSTYGLEALVRWNRKGSILSPDKFLPIAEKTGFIRHLGLYGIKLICQQLRRWQHCSSLVVHVNISAQQLQERGFADAVECLCEHEGVNARALCFEITENALKGDTGAYMQEIRQLHAFGVRFCLDDFGTGFSSLSYLRHLPVDSIKLDRSFVAGLETDPKALIIVSNLVRLGEDLGFTIVAGGVEHVRQAELIQSVGCGFAQGFHYHRPMDANSVTKFLL